MGRNSTDKRQVIFQSMSNGLSFNRGALMNVGYQIAMMDDPMELGVGPGQWDCLVFHDLDMLPMKLENVYKCGAKVSIVQSLHLYRSISCSLLKNITFNISHVEVHSSDDLVDKNSSL